MYATAKWMADFYMCSLGETMRLFIPGKNSVKIRPVFNINDENITLEIGKNFRINNKLYINTCKHIKMLIY